METRRLTKMALLTALLCISAYISFPLPFSPAMVTALTLVATLIGLLLQPKDALSYLSFIFCLVQLGYQYLLAVRLVLANCWDQQVALFFLGQLHIHY